jgi:argininosuccinate lyase
MNGLPTRSSPEFGRDGHRQRRWQSLGQTVSAHVVMLFDVGLIDADTSSVLLGAIERVSAADAPDSTLAGLVAAFDDRLDAQTPAGVAGTARVGRGTADTLATALRLLLREQVLALGDALDDTRRAALDLAANHVTTLMPAYLGPRPAQPTNFAHFLGGLIGPLGRIAARLPGVYAEVNRSPLGAASLAATGMPIERERTAELLGFDGLLANTFDAVAAFDHVLAAGDLAADAAIAVRRLLVELLTWLRTEPDSFLLADDWTIEVPELPQLRVPTQLEALRARADGVEEETRALRQVACDLEYGPIAWTADQLYVHLDAAVDRGIAVLSDTSHLLATGLDVNRAYLANRAGRNHTTAGDLADFLMIEEQLDPGTAQTIAARTIARIIAEGKEVSGITPEIIDGAALLVIGRELKVEFETISRYLAPRRFLERRTATGAPSPTSTRAGIDQDRIRLGTDERWRAGARERLVAAERSLRQSIDDAMAATAPG